MPIETKIRKSAGFAGTRKCKQWPVTVKWICHGIPPFETLEAVNLSVLRKSRVIVPNVGAFEVTFAQRVGEKLVARCWPSEAV